MKKTTLVYSLKSSIGGFRGLFLFFIFEFSIFNSNAQTVKIYRSGSFVSTHSTVASASASSHLGDSIVLSANTFKEHDIPIDKGRIWKGSITATDTTIIDAEGLGKIFKSIAVRPLRKSTFIDIIFTNGNYGCLNGIDSLFLKGYSIVRNCYSPNFGGGVDFCYAFDHVKITNNRADSFGGGGIGIYAFDSVEISYNTAAYGGAMGYLSGGSITCNSPGVRIHHNTATIAGGAFYGDLINMTAGQITDNQAPLGAALHTVTCGTNILQNCLIYNPRPDGTRQNEIYIRSGVVNIEGSWFGQNDTVGLIRVNPPGCAAASARNGRAAKANWSINRGKALSKKDTLFPIGAVFTYSDGMPLPVNSLPWLRGSFSASKGTVLTPNPIISPLDTMFSQFRTYTYAPGDTGGKPVSFVCIVDADTFRAIPLVWGRDTSKLGIGKMETKNVLVFPNPASDFIYIQGAEIGSNIALYDMEAKLILDFVCAQVNKQRIDLRALPRGNYVLKITTKEGQVGTSKVLKE